MKINRLLALATGSALLLAAMPLAVSAESDDIIYVKMNIPYADFYQADVVNDIAVDAVSSATDKKWQKFDSAAYSVATDMGGEILGVSFPVAMTKETYDCLTPKDNSSDDYYFEVLEETPVVYKTLTVTDGNYVFSKVMGESVECGEDVTYTFKTDTVWGDYQLELENISFDTVYGVIITTDNGTQYGLRHLENIWLKNYEYAWSTGIKTTEPHGNTLNYEHYKSMMGETITNVTVIANDAIYSVPADQYVAIKTGNTVSVANANVNDSHTTLEFSDTLPVDFEPIYEVEGLAATCDGKNIYFENAKAGAYTLTVSDASNKYASFSTAFILSTDQLPAVYDSTNKKIVVTEGYTDEDIAAYIANISTVSVNGTSYAATGKRGVAIINSDGTINMEAALRDEAIFAADIDSFEMIVSAAGYPDLAFTLNTKVVEESSKEPSAQPSEQPSNQPSENSNTDTPTTSDASDMWTLALAVMAAVSALGVFAATKARKSR